MLRSAATGGKGVSDFVRLTKTTFSPGEPIFVDYDLSTAVASSGGVGLGIVQRLDVRAQPQFRFKAVTTGVGQRTIRFSETEVLPSGAFWITTAGRFQMQNYGEFSVAPANGWAKIGDGYNTLSAVNVDLYATRPGSSLLYRYGADRPGESAWMSMDWPVDGVVGGDGPLYGRSPESREAMEFDQLTGQWRFIGSAMRQLFATGRVLYGVTPDGDVMAFSGRSAWTKLGSDASVVVATNKYVFKLSADGSRVDQFGRESGTWTQMGPAMRDLLIGSNALYGIDPGSGSVLRFNGTPMSWTPVGAAGAQFVARDRRLIRLASDRQSVWEYLGTPGEWQQICGPADRLVLGQDSLFGLLGSTVLAQEFGDGRARSVAMDTARPVPLVALDAQVTPANWLFSFKTSDKLGADYQGPISLSLFLRRSVVAQFGLPGAMSYGLAGTYLFPLSLPYVTELDELSVIGEANWFNDHWCLDRIDAWYLAPGAPNAHYGFNYQNEVVPNYPEATPTIVPVRDDAPQPKSHSAIVSIWFYLGKSIQWGHASLTLTDGTHVSWWPMAALSTGLMSAVAYPHQTYADDVRMEGQLPDFTMPLACMDETAIKTWWQLFNVPGAGWDLMLQNCATTVRDALFAGGAGQYIPALQLELFQTGLWTPARLAWLCQVLQAHENYSPQ